MDIRTFIITMVTDPHFWCGCVVGITVLRLINSFQEPKDSCSAGPSVITCERAQVKESPEDEKEEKKETSAKDKFYLSSVDMSSIDWKNHN